MTDITIHVYRGRFPDESGERPYLTKKAAANLMRSAEIDYDHALRLVERAVGKRVDASMSKERAVSGDYPESPGDRSRPIVVGKSNQIVKITVRK